MKIKITLIVLCLCISSSFVSQEKNKKTTYMKLKDYKKKFNLKSLNKDSLNFKIIKNDTFVKVESILKRRGISIPYEFKDDNFLNLYKKVAFKHKKNSFSLDTKMKYWKKPIKIFFSKSIDRKTKKDFLKFASYLSDNVDSLNISEVKKIEKSNYIIYYSKGFEYESRMGSYKNSDYYMYWNKNNQIYKCALRINMDNDLNKKLRLYKIKELFFKSLGHFKFTDDFNCRNFFANCYSEEKKVSKFDLDLLKYHYSYGICKGTSLKVFEESHKKAKEVFKKGHRISFRHPN